MGHVLVSGSKIYLPKVPSSFEVPPLPVIKIVFQLGSLGEAIFHTISVGYQF